MKFEPVGIEGAWLVHPEAHGDERGFFARMWSHEDFARHGVNAAFLQCNNSFSAKRGTLRGLHYQAAPHGEAKLVRCVSGSVFDVLVDMRTDSPTYRRWFGVELTARNRTMLYVPEECAHAYLTLEDESEVIYWVTAAYAPGAERGVRWNDPAIGIDWPIRENLILSAKDRAWPDVDVNAPYVGRNFSSGVQGATKVAPYGRAK